MRCAVLFVLLACCCLGSARAQEKDSDALEKSVNKALKYLKEKQEPDGCWKLGTQKSTAATSLAIMAFLSAGHVPGEGKYAEVIDKGVRWVAEAQQSVGLPVLNTSSGANSYEMYSLGISTLMLAEVNGMVDAKLAPKVKKGVEKGITLILKSQRLVEPCKGGWRYSFDSPDADVSVTGWQLLALKAAKNIGCDVPAQRIQLALGYIKSSQEKKSGGFHYTPGGQVTAPCTATAILCLELCEAHHTEAAKSGGAYLLQHPPNWQDNYFSYHAYYCAQAAFQLGGNYWDFYRPRLHKILFAEQAANGSWLPAAEAGFGASYSTSMSVLALTVEYRYLPLYQRGDD